MCSTGLKDSPEAAVHLTFLSQWLVSSSSPFKAICLHLPSDDFFSRNNPRVPSHIYDTLPDFRHTIGSAANCSSTGSDFIGSDAIAHLKLCENSLDSDICTSFVDLQRAH